MPTPPPQPRFHVEQTAGRTVITIPGRLEPALRRALYNFFSGWLILAAGWVYIWTIAIDALARPLAPSGWLLLGICTVISLVILERGINAVWATLRRAAGREIIELDAGTVRVTYHTAGLRRTVEIPRRALQAVRPVEVPLNDLSAGRFPNPVMRVPAHGRVALLGGERPVAVGLDLNAGEADELVTAIRQGLRSQNPGS